MASQQAGMGSQTVCLWCHILQSDGEVKGEFNLWKDSHVNVHFIPQGLLEGKELMVDEWEVTLYP